VEGQDLRLDFLNFEKLFFKNDSFNNDNFYILLDNKDIRDFFSSYIKNNFLEDSNLDKIFLNQIKNFIFLFKNKNLNYENFLYFKTDVDVLNAYLFLFLLKSFSLKFKIKDKEEGFFELSLKDFLFDRNDFINIFLDYLYKFLIFSEIKTNNCFNFTRDYLRKFIFRFIELLAKKNIISIIDIKTYKRHYKCLKFIPFKVPYFPHIVLYSEKFTTYVRSANEFFAYNKHFFSLIEITKRAKYSNSYFKTPIDQISMLQERSLFIDRSLLEKNFFFLLKAQNLKENQNLDEYLENISEKIAKFIKEHDLGSLKFYHSKLSKILTLIRLKTVLSMNFNDIKLYLPFMFCFRGRVYELSDLSFTFYKEFRFCLYTGFYEKEEENFHPINSQINKVIEDQFNLLNKYDWFVELSLIRKRACVWSFLSLGALKKTDLGKKVHVSSFIQKGIELWEKKNNNEFSDVYEKIEANYLEFLIKDLATSKPLKKWLFWKDAPASCFQHLLQILGPSNKDSYKICNLDSIDTWYDPYTYLILDFFENKFDKINDNLKLNKNQFFEIFSRKRLKKIFMTESYGAGYKKLTSFFILDLNLENFSESTKATVMYYWNELFEYISNQNILFSQSSKEITEYFNKNNIKKIVNPDKSEVDFSCFKIEIKQIEIYVEKKRHTLQNRVITTEEDVSQFDTSLRANFVQTRDGFIARRYILLTRMWTVHDCFSIDLLNITFMVSIINELMNSQFYEINISTESKKTIFSIFIIL